jgi:hypothetical protein
MAEARYRFIRELGSGEAPRTGAHRAGRPPRGRRRPRHAAPRARSAALRPPANARPPRPNPSPHPPSGAFGSVVLAMDTRTGEQVAVKKMVGRLQGRGRVTPACLTQRL